jgi:DNA-binding response OmpR family regulator
MFRQSTAGPDQILDIVIYEEDHLTRNLLREWLGEAGYRVRRGELREAQSARPADLVIASIYMPKQSGSKWVRDIRAAHPGVPLIAISGQFRSGLRAAGETAQSLGVQQVMAKPLVRVDLLSAVRDMIGTPH